MICTEYFFSTQKYIFWTCIFILPNSNHSTEWTQVRKTGFIDWNNQLRYEGRYLYKVWWKFQIKKLPVKNWIFFCNFFSKNAHGSNMGRVRNFQTKMQRGRSGQTFLSNKFFPNCHSFFSVIFQSANSKNSDFRGFLKIAGKPWYTPTPIFSLSFARERGASFGIKK